MALLRDGQPVAEYSWLAAGRHTAQLLPVLDGLCRDVGVPVESWSAVAVAIGPGSFNGIRSGIAAALGLAVSRNIPLCGIGTLDILAYQAHLGRAPAAAPPLCAVLPAGRGEVYYALYAPDRAAGVSGSWAEAARVVGPAVAPPEDVARDLAAYGAARGDAEGAAMGRVILCGTLPPEAARPLTDALGGGATWLEPPATLRRASYLALLASQYLGAGGQDQTETVRPIYVRRVNVTRSKRAFAPLFPEGT